MSLSKENIEKELQHPLPVFVFDEIDSTNEQAKRYEKSVSSKEALFASSFQSAGRASKGRSFYSPKDTGLYMTLMLPIRHEIRSLQTLTCAAAVAVCRAIEALSDVTPTIKWVNDVYVDEKKVCGILSELICDEHNRPCAVIVGIGVNLTTEEFPEEIRSLAGSVGDIDPERLCAAISDQLVELYDELESAAFLEDYKRRCRFFGKKIVYFTPYFSKEATAIDIDDHGGLIVEDDSGKKTLSSGEISIRMT